MIPNTAVIARGVPVYGCTGGVVIERRGVVYPSRCKTLVRVIVFREGGEEVGG